MIDPCLMRSFTLIHFSIASSISTNRHHDISMIKRASLGTNESLNNQEIEDGGKYTLVKYTPVLIHSQK